MGQMMAGGTGTGPAIPKQQLMSVIGTIRKQLLRKLLENKKQSMEERFQYYKQDAQKYRDCIASAMQSQQALFQDTIMEVLGQQNIPQESFGMSLKQHMMDPDVQEKFSLMQTATLDMCEGQPVPEDLDKTKFVEVITFTTEEMMKYPVKDMQTSIMAQVAAADEVKTIYGYDEVTMAAAAIKFENDPDPVLKEAKDKWNAATRNPLFSG